MLHMMESKMPLWNIYHPVGAYSAEDKQNLAERIAVMCYGPLPKFYVGVLFQEVAKGSFLMGAKSVDNFVRIKADHIARTLPSVEAKQKWMARAEEAIAPYIKQRGYDWEIHVDETSPDLWSIQGLRPPVANSEAEKRWKEENRPSPY
jgi:phenylpyruvate tautomerase PptA (4-oxalocrotonate tautomerase family)